jgi:hypothetical protein
MKNKLKQIIFNGLYEDLKNVEIIPYNNSIWFIDREKKYWYLEYEKSGDLWWRWDFFYNFFPIFSMERNEFEWIIAEWVEEVLNCKIEILAKACGSCLTMVEEVLNCKIKTPLISYVNSSLLAEEVLNYGVTKSSFSVFKNNFLVKEVLNCKVTTPYGANSPVCSVEDVLDCRVRRPIKLSSSAYPMIKEVLNCKVETPRPLGEVTSMKVIEVLNSAVKTIENER